MNNFGTLEAIVTISLWSVVLFILALHEKLYLIKRELNYLRLLNWKLTSKLCQDLSSFERSAHIAEFNKASKRTRELINYRNTIYKLLLVYKM